MNLGLFNRMNLKVKIIITKSISIFDVLKFQESSENKGMYSEWTSLGLTLNHGAEDNESVLEKFGLPVGKEITSGIVHQLASNLGITQPQEPSFLVTDKDVSNIL